MSKAVKGLLQVHEFRQKTRGPVGQRQMTFLIKVHEEPKLHFHIGFPCPQSPTGQSRGRAKWILGHNGYASQLRNPDPRKPQSFKGLQENLPKPFPRGRLYYIGQEINQPSIPVRDTTSVFLGCSHFINLLEEIMQNKRLSLPLLTRFAEMRETDRELTPNIRAWGVRWGGVGWGEGTQVHLAQLVGSFPCLGFTGVTHSSVTHILPSPRSLCPAQSLTPNDSQ